MTAEAQQAATETLTLAALVTPWIGPAIVAAIVTFLGQIILTRLTRSQEKEKEEQKAWTDAVMPGVEAADETIARFFDIIVRKRKFAVDPVTQEAVSSPELLKSPPMALTTVFRLVKFLSCVTYLQRRVPFYGDIKRIRQADLYFSNKVRMALKGNVAGSSLRLATEAQQCIGSKFLAINKDETPHQLDFYHFVKVLRSDEEALALANLAATVLNFSSDFSDLKPEQVAFALVLIYMIDAHQDTLASSKWEEFRVFLASVVRTWNSRTGAKAIFLYAPGDLSTADYTATFARQDFLNEADSEKTARLRKRQSRGRSISSSGITKAVRGKTVELRFADQPGDVLAALISIT